MSLKDNITIFEPLLEKALEYVNKGWHMSYKLEDIAGVEMSNTYIFLHLDKEDFSKEAYPIPIEINFK